MVQGASQVVLVGDHRQLGPCTSALAEGEGLAVSLFERLLQGGVKSHMLNVQYRMHPDIARWPSQQYYGGKLMNGDNTTHLKGVCTCAQHQCLLPLFSKISCLFATLLPNLVVVVAHDTAVVASVLHNTVNLQLSLR